MKNLEHIKRAYLALALASVGIGIVFMVKPGIAVATMCRICGVFFLIYGLVRILGYFSKDLFQLAFQFDFAMGLFSMVTGVIFLARVERVAFIFPGFVALFIVIDAVLKLQTALDARKFGLERWWIIMIIAILAAAVGVCLTLLSMQTTEFLIWMLGVNLCLDGCLNFWVVLKTVITLRRK